MERVSTPPLVFCVSTVESSTVETRITVYGRELGTGRSIIAYCCDFFPYFYAECTRDAVDELIKKEELKSVETVRRIPLMGYQQEREMLKLTFLSPKFIAGARDLLEGYDYPTHEASTLFEMRFMVDYAFGGNDWVQIDAYDTETYEFSCCRIRKSPISEQLNSEMGDFVWLAFDIEAYKKIGKGFVDAKLGDPVSHIGMTLFTSCYKRLDRRVLALVPPGRNVGRLADPEVRVDIYENQADLLVAFRDYVAERDPDVLVGYNIDGFDLPYMFDSAAALKVAAQFASFSRQEGALAKLRKAQFSSKAKGARVDYELSCAGRYTFDVLKAIKDSVKLRSYRLGFVAEHFLKDSKVEMPYQLIPEYQHGTDEQRAHLSYYCWWDADLCVQLMQKRMLIVNYVETARVCGVPLKFLLSRGQQILTYSLMLRFGQQRNFVMPSRTESQNDEETKGATVKEPEVGFHRDPVVTLDFQSLYPSIIQDRNICYSTKVSLKWARANLSAEDYHVPNGIHNPTFCFVKPHIRLGLLPEIEQTLFYKRQAAKADMEKEKDPDKKDVFNGRQNAIKVRMNSIYGFLKANKICDKDLMEAVTAEGRWMLEQTTRIVEENFPNCKVIYGDTDSVFIKFIGRTLDQAFDLGEQAAAMCTAFFTEGHVRPVHVLQCEKAFLPFLLASKKKYAGLKYMTRDSEPKFSASGLENVRRDNAKIGSATLDEALRIIIVEGDYDGTRAIAYVHERIRQLLLGQIPYSELIISKNLSKTFADYAKKNTKQAHVELAKRIDARRHETGEEGYATGDRVKFVMVAGPKNSKVYERAEDPLYALTQQLSIDYHYYIWKQMMRPLLRVFTPIIAPGEKLRKRNKKDDEVAINDKEILSLTAYKVLFTGEHMRKIVTRAVEGADGIMKFARIKPSCLGCSCSVAHGHTLCDACQPNSRLLYLRFMGEQQLLEQQHWVAWSKCQRCVKSYHRDVVCRNTDCDNFYHRTKMQMNLRDVRSKMMSIDY